MAGTTTSTARWPRPLRLLVAAVVALLAAEGAARAVEPSLPPPPGWPNLEIADKHDAIRRHGAVDLLVLGSSVADAGIDPATLPDTVAGDRGGYNSALLSASLQVTATWATEIAVPELDPDTVVLGVSTGDLVARAPGLDDWFFGAPEVRRLLGEESRADRLERWLSERSTLVRARSQLRDPGVVLDAIRLGTPPSNVTDAGLNTTLHGRPFDARPAVIAGITAALAGYTIDATQLEVLGDLTGSMVADGIRVVVVTMPYAEVYVGCHPRGQADIDDFEAAIAATVTGAGGEVVSFGVFDEALMADPLHLNEQGARLLTAQLADYLTAGTPPPG